MGWWGWGAGGARCSRRRHGASLDRALVPQPRKGAQRPASVWGSAPGCRCLQPPVAPRWWVLGSPQSSAGLGGVGGEPPTGPAAASSCTCGAEEGDAHLPGAPVSGPYEIWLFSWPGYCSNRLLASSLSASPGRQRTRAVSSSAVLPVPPPFPSHPQHPSPCPRRLPVPPACPHPLLPLSRSPPRTPPAPPCPRLSPCRVPGPLPMWQLCTQIRCPSYLQLHFMALLVKSLSATSKLGLMTTCGALTVRRCGPLPQALQPLTRSVWPSQPSVAAARGTAPARPCLPGRSGMCWRALRSWWPCHCAPCAQEQHFLGQEMAFRPQQA